MLSRYQLFSLAVALGIVNGVVASPACSRRSSDSCVTACRSKLGWPGYAMGTDAWGAVAKPYSGDLNSMVQSACGEPTGVSGGAATTANATEPAIAAPSPQSDISSSAVPSTSFPSVSTEAIIAPSASAAPTTTSTSTRASISTVVSSSSSASVHQEIASSSPVQPTTSSTPHTTSSSISVASPTSFSTSTASSIPTAKPSSSSSSSTKTQLIAAPATSSAVTSSTSTTSSSDISAYLTAHNTIRAEHGAADLTWSNDLAAAAQTWADKCIFEHSGGSLGPYGENLAAGTGDYSIANAVKDWTDEVSQYDASNPQPSHFTQVVWKATTQVGCAVQSCSGIFDASYGLAKFYVCEYSPAGNVIGQFANSSKQSWKNNIDVIIIGIAYAILIIMSIAFCLKRRIAVFRQLQKISKGYMATGKGEIPKSVHEYITQEYARACLIAYQALPKNAQQEGWGRPETKNSSVQYRRRLLDTVADLDLRARILIPSMPIPRPHDRILHHFRFIAPLIPRDEDGLSPLHYYDSAIQMARCAEREPTERQFEIGLAAARQIKKTLDECREEMLQGSTTELNHSPSVS
ncbi:hypothetical protein EW146_g94 [Bondarzewia mesenterica]|uniref:SCP domain-containing protein n=1 Tax=Bondarzewia mesenterica TaxID=1095465 RepID=A0A4S4MAC5_9AGAM|nr:hypothetical protein EW146_g94 [Bondarzewia mesenterica]